MSTAPPRHAYALLTPWYANEPARRGGTVNALIERPRRPVLQKYDNTDFVQRILRDPSDSLQFDDSPDPAHTARAPEDLWSFPVPVPFDKRPSDPANPALRLASYRMQTCNLRKLYQPSHQRFYAVATELFCDEFGYPMPGSTEGLEVRFVMRRIFYDVVGAKPVEIRRAARQLFQTGSGSLAYRIGMTRADRRAVDREALAVANTAAGRLEGTVLAGHTVVRQEYAWVPSGDGGGSWRRVLDPDSLTHGGQAEQELPMWAIPPRHEPATDPADPHQCDAAQRRSIWFGLPPTSSNEHDPSGHPKLDDEETYALRCFVRARDRDKPDCVHLYWSDYTESFRLAPFFDPQGTKNRRVRVKMPDLRALAAQAGQGDHAGGLMVESPLDSSPMFPANGTIPTSGTVGQDNCSFAIELLAIVAMFVFSLFLPILVFALQLWWLLLLRFCWPGNGQALSQLQAWFSGVPNVPGIPGGTGTHPPPAAGTLPRQELDAALAVFAGTGATAEPGPPAGGRPLPEVHDPLCREE